MCKPGDNSRDVLPCLEQDEGPRIGIFRTAAVRRHRQARHEQALPTLGRPRTIPLVAALMALLAAATGITWLNRVPVYTPGLAVAVPPARCATRAAACTRQAGQTGLPLVIVISATRSAALRAGQAVIVTTGTGGLVTAYLATGGSPLRGAPALQVWSGLLPPVRLLPPDSQVALAYLPGQGAPASTALGRSYQAQVQTGSVRVLSLIPLIGAHVPS